MKAAVTFALALYVGLNFCVDATDFCLSKLSETNLKDIKNLGVAWKCRDRWEDLKQNIRQTQMEVGYAWIRRKYESSDKKTEKKSYVNAVSDLKEAEKILEKAEDDLKEAEKKGKEKAIKNAQEAKDKALKATIVAQEKLDPLLTAIYVEDEIPVVIGPDKAFYIIDDHHSLSALDFAGDYNDRSSKTMVYLTVDTSLSELSIDEFWGELEKLGKTYLGAHIPEDDRTLPKKISYKALPQYFSFTNENKSLHDDPWRSLAGFSRKVESEYCIARNMTERCMRCMCRSSDTKLFFEFRWGYFMQYGTYHDISYWPAYDHFKKFWDKYSSIEKKLSMKKINVNDWVEAASLLVPLCRSEKAGTFELQKDLYPTTAEKNTLPGYYPWHVLLPEDPMCPAVETLLPTSTNNEL